MTQTPLPSRRTSQSQGRRPIAALALLACFASACGSIPSSTPVGSAGGVAGVSNALGGTAGTDATTPSSGGGSTPTSVGDASTPGGGGSSSGMDAGAPSTESGGSSGAVSAAGSSGAISTAGSSGTTGSGGGSAAPPGPGTWQTGIPLSSAARQELGVAAIGDTVYAVGGHSKLVDAFDTQNNVWRAVAPLAAALDHPNVAAVAGKIYVVGATEAEKTIPGDVNAFVVYDPAQDRWSKIRPMPAGTERAASGVAVIGTKIYVVGGWKNYGIATSNFSVYDTVSDTWESLPDILPKRDHLIAGAVNGIVYAVGGRNGTITTPMGSVAAFDPATRQWSPRASMLVPRGGMAGATLFDQIYVFGGEGNTAAGSNGVFAQTDVFDPLANAWRSLSPMKIAKHGIGAGVVRGKVYLPAGAIKQGGGAPVASMEIFVP
jgi:N-acetylneuraminic acid mutarotase